MNTRSLFQKISQRMKMDFEAAAVIQHAGSKGTVRELTSDQRSRAVHDLGCAGYAASLFDYESDDRRLWNRCLK